MNRPRGLTRPTQIRPSRPRIRLSGKPGRFNSSTCACGYGATMAWRALTDRASTATFQIRYSQIGSPGCGSSTRSASSSMRAASPRPLTRRRPPCSPHIGSAMISAPSASKSNPSGRPPVAANGPAYPASGGGDQATGSIGVGQVNKQAAAASSTTAADEISLRIVSVNRQEIVATPGARVHRPSMFATAIELAGLWQRGGATWAATGPDVLQRSIPRLSGGDGASRGVLSLRAGKNGHQPSLTTCAGVDGKPPVGHCCN